MTARFYAVVEQADVINACIGREKDGLRLVSFNQLCGLICSI